MSHRARATVRAVLKWTPAVVLLAIVAQQVVGRWGELAGRGISFSVAPAVVATLGLALHLAVACQCWRLLLRGGGVALEYAAAFRIIFLSNLAKYLPGGAWSMLGRAVLAERAGVPRVAAGSTILVEVACQVAAGLLVGILTQLAVRWGSPFLPTTTLILVALGIVGGVHPAFMNAALAAAQRLTRRALPRVALSYPFVLRMVALYTLNWTLLGASFALLGQALLPEPLTFEQAATLAGTFTVAWNIGVVAFVVPGGLGVREAALVVLLASAFPPGWPALLGVVARLWLLLAEVTAFLVALAIPALRSGRRVRMDLTARPARDRNRRA